MTTNIMQAFIDNWPEDEAYNIICEHAETLDCIDKEYADRDAIESIYHFCFNVFPDQSDCKELTERFFVRLKKNGFLDSLLNS
jgi:hypothetical protein